MKRVIAIAQAFKETLSATEVEEALAAGIRAAGQEPDVLIGSDGGDGLLDSLSGALERRTRHSASGPLGRPLEAEVGWLDAATAVVESRLVCGLSLVPRPERRPLDSTTRGVGEIILQVERLGARTVLVGLGGSATADAGVGMARAWGWRPLDAGGRELEEGGGPLAELAEFQAGRRPSVRLTGLCDVNSPLAGPTGAVVYAPQKGASRDDVARLARAFEAVAGLASRSGHGDLVSAPGAGAAGGLGFGLLYFGGGTLQSGAGWVLRRLGFPGRLAGAALLLVAEGGFDQTSLEGKLTGELLLMARQAGVSAAVVAPTARSVPPGITVETAPGTWSAADLADHARGAVERALRTSGNR